MSRYYAAVDLGASGGRLILGWMEDGRMKLEEIHRFENGMVRKNDVLCWEYDRIYGEIVTALKKCGETGKIPCTLGVDTWGVDFVLLDEQGQTVGDTVGYRDRRTAGMDEEVYKIVPEKELYRHTGIQKASFNTIFQLMALRLQHPDQLEKAETLLFVPDYFHYLLTGIRTIEYTEASTSGLLNAQTGTWDMDIIRRLGYPEKLFRELTEPGTPIGHIRPELAEEIGYDLEVIAPCAHDTGSAVLAVPANDDDFVYISSGTWSLMGVEQKKAVCTEQARKNNLTNEGGYGRCYRLLKNIMGLWMIQSVRHETGDAVSFAELCSMAEEARDFPSRVDCNDLCFLAPENMTEEVKDYCRRTGQRVPETLGELAAVIYTSLAECYARTIDEIEQTTGRAYSRIHVVGGGSNAAYLNELTAKATGREVHSGPGEATAIGNITAQMLHAGEFPSVAAARNVIRKSFDIRLYTQNGMAPSSAGGEKQVFSGGVQSPSEYASGGSQARSAE